MAHVIPRRAVLVGAMAAAVVVAACSEPDRSAAARGLGDRLAESPGIADVSVSYYPSGFEAHESLRVTATTEAGADPADACAAVRVFLDELPGTEIGANDSVLEVRDDSGAVRWSFAVRGDDELSDGLIDGCVSSQQTRAIEGAYAARASSGSDGAPPRVIVNFRSGDVPSAAAGLDRARAAVADFDALKWSIYVVCGEALCDRLDT